MNALYDNMNAAMVTMDAKVDMILELLTHKKYTSRYIN
jgi:hypothetical protein